MPVTVVLDRLRSAFNVGNVFRLAEATRVECVVTCGYTATPPHAKLARTARGCDAVVPFRHVADAVTALRELRAVGYTLYGVETAARARPAWETEFAFPAAVVLGNEALGVSAEALAVCDHLVDLPCLGAKNSINVGNCAAVVLYAAFRQWLGQCPQLQQRLRAADHALPPDRA
jgi:tRNA G18 (ribose-2'-O)-methylase SpoU